MYPSIRRSIYACGILVLLAGCGQNQASMPEAASPVAASDNAGPTAMATSSITPTAEQVMSATPAPATPTASPIPPTVSPTVTLVAEETTASIAASDLPVLAPENAPPLPAAAVSGSSAGTRPARVIIPEIALELETVDVGLDPQGVPVVPKHELGWFTASSVPGEGGNVVFWGHVLRWLDSPKIAAPLERIHELKPGAALTLINTDGQERQYLVSEQVRVQPDDTRYLMPTLGEHVTFVSCIGDKVIQNGMLTKEFRLVTIAKPVR